eukprot:766550-Hanusia_phi.AAC.4
MCGREGESYRVDEGGRHLQLLDRLCYSSPLVRTRAFATTSLSARSDHPLLAGGARGSTQVKPRVRREALSWKVTAGRFRTTWSGCQALASTAWRAGGRTKTLEAVPSGEQREHS